MRKRIKNKKTSGKTPIPAVSDWRNKKLLVCPYIRINPDSIEYKNAETESKGETDVKDK